GWGAWGGAAVANVYGVWGNTAYSRTGAAWANPYTGNYGAATSGAYHNTQTGRSTIAGRGYNTNIYTGNTYGYRGGATYNPNTGIVRDRKSTRLNSSHVAISYAVFCSKKKMTISDRLLKTSSRSI